MSRIFKLYEEARKFREKSDEVWYKCVKLINEVRPVFDIDVMKFLIEDPNPAFVIARDKDGQWWYADNEFNGWDHLLAEAEGWYLKDLEEILNGDFETEKVDIPGFEEARKGRL